MPTTRTLNDLDWIDPNAMEIIVSLNHGNFKAYLVGGCVRDYLAGVSPKDFDIATDALPNQIKKLVRRAYIIGKRFRLVLVHRGNLQYEVATFRRDPSEAEKLDEDVQNDNVFGDPKADASRRDFTINALFYDPQSKQIIDYVDGLKDIESRTLRIIGDPSTRIKEDPIRILRALRLSHKLNFQIEPELRKAILEEKDSLKNSALPRKREDLLKILRLPHPCKCLVEMADLGVLHSSFPILDQIYLEDSNLDIFESCLRRIGDFVDDWSEPKELFAVLCYAIIKSRLNDATNSDEQIFHKILHIQDSLREEIGMFKSEIEIISKAIAMIPSFSDIDSYSRKGKRRQSAFLGNEAFPIGLELAYWDYHITSAEYQYWREAYISELPKLVREDVEKLRGSRRGNYRR